MSCACHNTCVEFRGQLEGGGFPCSPLEHQRLMQAVGLGSKYFYPPSYLPTFPQALFGRDVKWMQNLYRNTNSSDSQNTLEEQKLKVLCNLNSVLSVKLQSQDHRALAPDCSLRVWRLRQVDSC